VHTQIKRAKARADSLDVELLMDVMLVLSESDDKISDAAALQRIATKLQLKALPELKAEGRALQRLIKERGAEVDENLEKMSVLLTKLRMLVELPNTEAETLDLEALALACSEKPGSPVVPNDFKCPITLELMKDPVIVATGQVCYFVLSLTLWLRSLVVPIYIAKNAILLCRHMKRQASRGGWKLIRLVRRQDKS
jgi:hypothetical protein